MNERGALALLRDHVMHAGDDAAVIDGLVFTIDMLHERTDFPDGVTRYTAGWRSVGASLSDIAAMGAQPIATLAAYGAPTFEADELDAFVRGAQDVSTAAGAAYVGGDLDTHDEFTVATAAIGRTENPITRSGAQVGDRVYVTGTFGRSAAGIDCFEQSSQERGNELFQFSPRVAPGLAVAEVATAMMDSSDGLSRSLHQLADASQCGFSLQREKIPVDPALDPEDDRALFFGEDFELVFTATRDPPSHVADVPITEIGRVTDEDVLIDGSALPDRGFSHG